MGLTIVDRGDLYCPVLICDQCGQPIESALGMGGIALWKHPGGSIHFVHQGRCDIEFCRATGTRDSDWQSEELHMFIQYLVNNTLPEWCR